MSRALQTNYSRHSESTLDPKSRLPKAAKILAVLRDFYKLENFKQLNCLDIGCAGGIITSFLAEEFNLVIGLDTDTDALKAAVNSYNHDNILYEKGNGIRLPFASKQFDVVVCNHIYEHVPSSSKLLKEIKRVLKDDGVCYFSAGNRCWPIEPHYKIPFLSWLPRNIANRYLQITGKGDSYYERLLPLWRLRKLAKDFHIHDYTIHITLNPEKYNASDVFTDFPLLPLISKIPKQFLRRLLYIAPCYIWLLTKRTTGENFDD